MKFASIIFFFLLSVLACRAENDNPSLIRGRTVREKSDDRGDDSEFRSNDAADDDADTADDAGDTADEAVDTADDAGDTTDDKEATGDSQTSNDSEEKSNAIEVALKKGDQQEIQLPLGHTVCVKIAGNPTTGFSWFLGDETSHFGVEESAPLKRTFSSYEPSGRVKSGGLRLVGGGGTFSFCFEGVRCGVANLNFEEKRPWEGGEHGGTANLIVFVKEADRLPFHVETE